MHEIYNYHLNIYYVCNMVMSFYIAYTVLFSLCFFLISEDNYKFHVLKLYHSLISYACKGYKKRKYNSETIIIIMDDILQ